MFSEIFNQVDKLFSKWLGCRYAIRPEHLKIVNNKIFITSTEANKRFPHSESLKQFILEIPYVDRKDKEKLGIAIGKAIAEDLIISFEKVEKN